MFRLAPLLTAAWPPPAGTVLSLPLPGGRIASCRVLRPDGAAAVLDASPFAPAGYRTTVRYATPEGAMAEAPVVLEPLPRPLLLLDGEPRVHADRRASDRVLVRAAIVVQPLRRDGSRVGLPFDGMLHDLSPSGAGIWCSERLRPGDLVELWIDAELRCAGRVAREADLPLIGRINGIAFLDHVAGALIAHRLGA